MLKKRQQEQEYDLEISAYIHTLYKYNIANNLLLSSLNRVTNSFDTQDQSSYTFAYCFRKDNQNWNRRSLKMNSFTALHKMPVNRSVRLEIGEFRHSTIANGQKRCFFLMRSLLHYLGENGVTPLLRHLRDQAGEGEFALPNLHMYSCAPLIVKNRTNDIPTEQPFSFFDISINNYVYILINFSIYSRRLLWMKR